MATEALWSNIQKGIYFNTLKQGKPIKVRWKVLSLMYLTPLSDPVMFGSFVQKRTETRRGYNTRRKRCQNSILYAACKEYQAQRLGRVLFKSGASKSSFSQFLLKKIPPPVLFVLSSISLSTYSFFQVADVRIISDRNSRRSKGIAYVEFTDRSAVPLVS